MTTKFQVGKTYKTRNGDEVRIIATDRNTQDYPVVGLRRSPDMFDGEVPEVYTADGHFSVVYHPNEFDLVDTDERWLNLYKFHPAMPFASRHDSQRAAEESRRAGSMPLIGRVKITYTDGLPTGVELVPV